MYLENMGCFRNIIVASDGVDATVKLSNQTFGLILLDTTKSKPDLADRVVLKIKKCYNNFHNKKQSNPQLVMK